MEAGGWCGGVMVGGGWCGGVMEAGALESALAAKDGDVSTFSEVTTKCD